MGHEYRLHVDPPDLDLDEVCDSIFASSDWRRIKTSFEGVDGIGVQRGELPDFPSWPHAADLYLEGRGVVFVLCHNQGGGEFMRALVESLREGGHEVRIDDDV